MESELINQILVFKLILSWFSYYYSVFWKKK